MDKLIEECSVKLKKNSVLHRNGECIIWTGCINKQGYGQFRFRFPRETPGTSHRTKTCHRIAIMVYYRDFDISASQQASHLCNNKLCINTDHLALESSSLNNLRKNCFSNNRCYGHLDTDGNQLPNCLVELSS